MMSEFLKAITTPIYEGVHIFHVQDQLLQLYLAGTDPHVREFSTKQVPDYNIIPSKVVSCIILSVPRKAFERVVERYPNMEAYLNHRVNLFLRIRLTVVPSKKDEEYIDRLNKVQFFSSTIPIFGKLILSPDGKNCVIEPDPKGWKGSSELQVCTYVPTRSLETMREGHAPHINLQLNADNGAIAALGGIDYTNFHSALLFDRNHVTIVDAMPGLRTPKPKLLASPFEEWSLHNDSATTPKFNFSEMKFTSRLTLRQESSKAALASGAPIKAESTPCTMNISFGDYQNRLTFPYPFIAGQSKITANRKSGWLDVTVLLTSKKGGYLAYPFPVLREPAATCNWNLPRVSFKTLHKIEIPNPSVSSWVIKHLHTMFSEHERQLLKSNPDDTPGLTRFKVSVYNILVSLAQSQGPRIHVIKAQVDDTEPIVLHARRLYLNDTTHSIVAKAYMHPYIPGIGPSETLGSHADAKITIVVGKEAFTLWKEALPAMVESCRDWEHRQDCSFNDNGIPIAMGSGEGDSPLCLCTMLDGSRKGTRFALFPIFGAPYLEELRDRHEFESLSVAELALAQTSQGSVGSLNQNGRNDSLCNLCGKAGTKKCAQCEKVKYCSRTCQRQD
jgi:hypothetical protein